MAKEAAAGVRSEPITTCLQSGRLSRLNRLWLLDSVSASPSTYVLVQGRIANHRIRIEQILSSVAVHARQVLLMVQTPCPTIGTSGLFPRAQIPGPTKHHRALVEPLPVQAKRTAGIDQSVSLPHPALHHCYVFPAHRQRSPSQEGTPREEAPPTPSPPRPSRPPPPPPQKESKTNTTPPLSPLPPPPPSPPYLSNCSALHILIPPTVPVGPLSRSTSSR